MCLARGLVVDRGLTLSVHHRHYDTIGAERPEDVRLLCSKCHADLHFARERAKRRAQQQQHAASARPTCEPPDSPPWTTSRLIVAPASGLSTPPLLRRAPDASFACRSWSRAGSLSIRQRRDEPIFIDRLGAF